MAEGLVRLGSHFFTLSGLSPRLRVIIHEYVWTLASIKMFRRSDRRGSFFIDKQVDAIYCDVQKGFGEYRFHIQLLPGLKEFLRGKRVVETLLEWQHIPLHEPTNVEFSLRPGLKPWDYQVDAINYFSQRLPPMKLLGLPPGRGKSMCAIGTMVNLQVRTGIWVPAKYMEKWATDLVEKLEITPKDITLVSGEAALMRVLDDARQGLLKSKIIIFSLQTYTKYLDKYLEYGPDGLYDLGYACAPEQAMALLGIGFKVVDEVHEFFHQHYRVDLYINVHNTASLSATLLTRDRFLKNLYETVYPLKDRVKTPEFPKYIKSHAVFYNLKYPHEVVNKVMRNGMYSHVMLEEQLMKSAKRLESYFEMINRVLYRGYMQRHINHDKCLIFVATIEMATKLTEWLKKKHTLFDVRRYCEDDPFENILEAEITVSTLISAGTAIDLPQLTCVIMSNALSSDKGNVQGSGRLRELKDGRNPEFYYLVCQDIRKHMDYHQEKVDLFGSIMLSQTVVAMGTCVV